MLAADNSCIRVVTLRRRSPTEPRAEDDAGMRLDVGIAVPVRVDVAAEIGVELWAPVEVVRRPAAMQPCSCRLRPRQRPSSTIDTALRVQQFDNSTVRSRCAREPNAQKVSEAPTLRCFPNLFDVRSNERLRVTVPLARCRWHLERARSPLSAEMEAR